MNQGGANVARKCNPVNELFLVLPEASSKLAHYRRGLSPLIAAIEEGPLLLGSDLYYRDDTDVALVAIRFHPASMLQRKRKWLVEIANGADVVVLDPDRLDQNDQLFFYHNYLRRYPVRIEDVESPGPPLEKLSRLLDVEASGTGRLSNTPVADEAHPSPTASPSDSSTSYSVQRQGLTKRKLHRSRRSSPVAGPAPKRGHGSQTLFPIDKPPARDNSVVVNFGRPTNTAATSHGTPRPARPFARATSPATLIAGEREPSRDAKTTLVLESVEKLQKGVRSASENHLNARFAWGERWFTARLRSLTTRDAQFATGAPPPIGAPVTLAFDLGDLATEVDAVVVDAESDPVDGSCGFRAAFEQCNEEARARVVALLHRAKDLGVSLKAPPRRHAARFPLAWPVTLSSSNGTIVASALDVSQSGLFLATQEEVNATELDFAMELDAEGSVVSGHARVARKVTDGMARSRGLQRGYGLEILDIRGNCAERFRDFVERVKRRGERHLITAGTRQCVDTLTRALISAGYAVTGATNASELVRRGILGKRKPDFGVLDESVAGDATVRRQFERVFDHYEIPFMVARRGALENTRSAVDQALSVGA